MPERKNEKINANIQYLYETILKVETLEECLLNEGIINKPAEKEYLPMQPGDVYQTYADVDELVKDFNFKPSTSLKDGLSRYAKWYKEFYQL